MPRPRTVPEKQPYLLGYSAATSVFSPLATAIQLCKEVERLKVTLQKAEGDLAEVTCRGRTTEIDLAEDECDRLKVTLQNKMSGHVFHEDIDASQSITGTAQQEISAVTSHKVDAKERRRPLCGCPQRAQLDSWEWHVLQEETSKDSKARIHGAIQRVGGGSREGAEMLLCPSLSLTSPFKSQLGSPVSHFLRKRCNKHVSPLEPAGRCPPKLAASGFATGSTLR